MAAAGDGAPAEPAGADDLNLALGAIAGIERIQLRAGKLIETDEPLSEAARATRVLVAQLGARKLLEVTHNNQAHKLIALSRGALPCLSRSIGRYRSALYRAQASRALRSVSFKVDEARAVAVPTGALSAAVRVLSEAMAVLEFHHSSGSVVRQLASLEATAAPAAAAASPSGEPGSAATALDAATPAEAGAGPAAGGAGGPSSPPLLLASITLLSTADSAAELAREHPAHALIALEEAAATLTCLVNRHGGLLAGTRIRCVPHQLRRPPAACLLLRPDWLPAAF